MAWQAIALTASAAIIEGAAIELEAPTDSYRPGEPYELVVRSPAIESLGAYNIELLITSSTGRAGVDFGFDADATQPPTEGYVFPSAENQADAITTLSDGSQRLTLTDFDPDGARVDSIANSAVAQVVVMTRPGFHGDLAIRVDTDHLLLDAPGSRFASVPEYGGILAATTSAAPLTIRSVPEPTAALLLAVGLSLAPRRWRPLDLDP